VIDGDGGTGFITLGSLTVRQTQNVHWQVQALLQTFELFAERGFDQGMVVIEPEWVPGEDTAAIRKALGRILPKIQFDKTPLKDVAATFADLMKVNVLLDTPALQEDGVNLDEPISLNATEIPVQTALNRALNRIGLTAVVSRGVLELTTQVKA